MAAVVAWRVDRSDAGVMISAASNTDVSHPAPSRRSRIVLGIAIALASAVYTWYQHGHLIAHGSAPDSLNLWRAANALLVGGNPWALHALNTAPHVTAGRVLESRIALAEPMYYPMPAVLLWVPLAKLPYLVASTLFNAGAAFLFVLAMTRGGLYRAWACGSVPFMIAMRFGQWSPLIVAAWVYPWLSAFLVAKPNLGVAVFVARVSRLASVMCTGFCCCRPSSRRGGLSIGCIISRMIWVAPRRIRRRSRCSAARAHCS
jgi:hypothetical protein